MILKTTISGILATLTSIILGGALIKAIAGVLAYVFACFVFSETFDWKDVSFAFVTAILAVVFYVLLSKYGKRYFNHV